MGKRSRVDAMPLAAQSPPPNGWIKRKPSREKTNTLANLSILSGLPVRSVGTLVLAGAWPAAVALGGPCPALIPGSRRRYLPPCPVSTL